MKAEKKPVCKSPNERRDSAYKTAEATNLLYLETLYTAIAILIIYIVWLYISKMLLVGFLYIQG
jgi:hypothetical protein